MTDRVDIPKRCEKCSADTLPLDPAQVAVWLADVPEWALVEEGKAIEREFVCRSFTEATQFLAFDVAGIADHEGHHPDVRVAKYRRLRLTLTTFAGGRRLTSNDFVMARLLDDAWKEFRAAMDSRPSAPRDTPT